MTEKGQLVVSEEDGRIVITQEGGTGGDVVDRYRAEGQDAAFFAESCDIHRHFIHRGRLRQRQPMLAQINKKRVKADGSDEIEIRGAPLGARVTVRHGVTSIEDTNDGIIRLVAPLPGLWTVEIEHPAYLPQAFEIIAE